MLLLAGCTLPGLPSPGTNATPGTNQTVNEGPPDYDYDLLITKIVASPANPVLAESYKSIVMVQTYGRYIPSAYHVWILEDGEILVDEDVQNPEVVEMFVFERFANDTAPHHYTAQVESRDTIHPENETKMDNNVLSANMQAGPMGFYDLQNPRLNWYYDAVGMQMKEAQSFRLKQPFNISRVGVYVQASVVQPRGSELIVSLYNEQPDENISGLGEKIISSKIDATTIGPDPEWVYAEYPRMELNKGKYWIVLEYSSPTSGGIEWYRAEGNPYGEFLDTQMMDIAGWGDWEFKGFDFAFKVE
jgi:hypothetical protein